MDGAIFFFRFPCLVGACCSVLGGRFHARFPIHPHHHLRSAGRVLGLGVFIFRPAPRCVLFSACLPHIVPRPPVGGRRGHRACSPSVGVGAVRLRCSCSVPLTPLVARSLCFVIAPLLFFSLRVSPVACLAAAMSSRRASLPPGSPFAPCLPVIRYPSDVAGRPVLRRLPLPLPLLACRCHPLGVGICWLCFDTPFALSGRVGVRGGLWRRLSLSCW